MSPGGIVKRSLAMVLQPLKDAIAKTFGLDAATHHPEISALNTRGSIPNQGLISVQWPHRPHCLARRRRCHARAGDNRRGTPGPVALHLRRCSAGTPGSRRGGSSPAYGAGSYPGRSGWRILRASSGIRANRFPLRRFGLTIDDSKFTICPSSRANHQYRKE